jgi:hypothetical protein
MTPNAGRSLKVIKIGKSCSNRGLGKHVGHEHQSRSMQRYANWQKNPRNKYYIKWITSWSPEGGKTRTAKEQLTNQWQFSNELPSASTTEIKMFS